VHRSSFGPFVLAGVLSAAMAGAQAHDEKKYPEWNGQWQRTAGVQWDPTKPLGRAQQPPLTAEYQAIFEAGLKDLAAGGQGNDTNYLCLPGGMPRAMTVVFPMEIIIMPAATYIAIETANQFRRIYTDGRKWPEYVEPSFLGYSIGKWEDQDANGRFHALVVETRFLKGPRTFDQSGIPLHQDNQTIVKERLYLDKANPDTLYDEITTIDNALTRPWTVTKKYRRDRKPIWVENICAEGNHHVLVGKENYYISNDGLLMPTRKGQAPPDLKYFNQPAK
jgi:hypothetical protein